ncbi:MAG: hypothetical protein ACK2U3_13550 [Anaerolineales bacterium]
MNPFLTIFSAPKPFTTPHINLIQRNAIQSWLNIGEGIYVILIGDEPGVNEIAAEFPVGFIPNVERNSSGTPLVSSIFTLARQATTSPYLAYVNADIILLPEFLDTLKKISAIEKQFLIIGQRWDLDIDYPMNFSPGWDQMLIRDVKKSGSLHLPAGSDYFIFPRPLFEAIPDFAIGRAGWDNWMIYNAKKHNWTVIDATPSNRVVHQNHDYSHLAGGRPHYEQEESFVNEDLAGGRENLYMVLDCDKQLRDGDLVRPPVTLVRSLRRLELLMEPINGRKNKTRRYLSRRFRRWRRQITGSL